jgi:4-amino-4-deoxy-L-arabinose transferase-like glycosyltransferase
MLAALPSAAPASAVAAARARAAAAAPGNTASAAGRPAAAAARPALPPAGSSPAPVALAIVGGLLLNVVSWSLLFLQLRARRKAAVAPAGGSPDAVRPATPTRAAHRWSPRALQRLPDPLAPRPLLPSVLPVWQERAWPSMSPSTRRLVLGGILLAAAALRTWQLGAVGLNSDEAVYAGQGAAIAGNADLAPYFPAFRAHPLLFQSVLSLGFMTDSPEMFGRLAAAAVGVATVYVTYLLGRLLYGTPAGLIAAALVALMPYHVVVTRQILLDGPRTLMATLTLYLLARYALTERPTWLNGAAAALGLTFLCKEDSVIMLGAVYTFLALTPGLRTSVADVIGAAAIFGLIVAALSTALDWAGKTSTGGDFLIWQLFRRPNHSYLFYPAVVPVAIGLGVLAAAAAGLWLLRRDRSWREKLLLSWIAVPVVFFELFPVKGFQYLLPVAPAVAVLAGRFLAHWDPRNVAAGRRLAPSLAFLRTPWTMRIALAAVLVTLAVPSWQGVQPSQASTFLAGSGGLPAGREAGRWIAGHVPRGAQMMSIGPSMANVLQFYGHRKVYGLSVSPNPLHRNPVYQALRNPDRLIRDNGLQYIVWDAFSADRSPFFAARIMRYVERYNGHVVHSETLSLRSADGQLVRRPAIVIYEVSP